MQTGPKIATSRRGKRTVRRAGLTAAVLGAALGLVSGCASAISGTAEQGAATRATAAADPGTSAHEPSLTEPADPTETPPERASDPTSDEAPPATERILVDPFDADGYLKPGYHVDTHNPIDVFGCAASLSAVSDNVFECAPYATHTNVCWPGSSSFAVLCSHDATSHSLFLVVSDVLLPDTKAVSDPFPWQLELADGSICAVRYGGAWEDGPGGLVGHYSCDGPSAFVLAAPSSHPVDTTDDVWTVQTGELGNDPAAPAPVTQAVTRAYFAAFAAGATQRHIEPPLDPCPPPSALSAEGLTLTSTLCLSDGYIVAHANYGDTGDPADGLTVFHAEEDGSFGIAIQGSSFEGLDFDLPGLSPDLLAYLGGMTVSVARSWTAFTSPSGNIVCELGATSAACSIGSSSAPVRASDLAASPSCTAGSVPVGATVSDVGELRIAGGSVGTVVCGGNEIASAANTLAYGEASRAGDMACYSRQDGVVCLNEATRHGFWLHHAGYSLF